MQYSLSGERLNCAWVRSGASPSPSDWLGSGRRIVTCPSQGDTARDSPEHVERTTTHCCDTRVAARFVVALSLDGCFWPSRTA